MLWDVLELSASYIFFAPQWFLPGLSLLDSIAEFICGWKWVILFLPEGRVALLSSNIAKKGHFGASKDNNWAEFHS